jgi:hypothetical protein
MGNVGKNSKCYTMSKARRLQSQALQPLFVNINNDRHYKRTYLRTRQGSDIMLILLIMQIRSHVNGVECDTGRIKGGENFNFFSYYF